MVAAIGAGKSKAASQLTSAHAEEASAEILTAGSCFGVCRVSAPPLV